MMIDSNKKVHTMGLEHRTAGFHPDRDNLPPSPKQIINKVKEITNEFKKSKANKKTRKTTNA